MVIAAGAPPRVAPAPVPVRVAATTPVGAGMATETDDVPTAPPEKDRLPLAAGVIVYDTPLNDLS